MRHPGHHGVPHRTTFSRFVRSAFLQHCGFLLAMICAPTAASSSEAFEALQLQHRDAEELIPLIQPLLDDETQLTGDDFRLVIRGTPEMILQVRELLETLDSPPKDLWVSVRQTHGEQDEGTSSRIHRTRERDAETFQVRVLEGQSALIRTGTASERALAGVVLVPWRGVVRVGGTRLEMQRGFLIRARIQGDGRVRIDIAEVHQQERIAGGDRADALRLATVVTGEMGDWIDIGPVLPDAAASDQRTRATTPRREQNAARVQVRVVAAD